MSSKAGSSSYDDGDCGGSFGDYEHGFSIRGAMSGAKRKLRRAGKRVKKFAKDHPKLVKGAKVAAGAIGTAASVAGAYAGGYHIGKMWAKTTAKKKRRTTGVRVS